MLITNGNLNIEEFREFFTKISWKKVPRRLSQNHKDYFYIGFYEDSDKIIKVSVRPSLRMQLSESFKNRTLDGEIPLKDYKGKLCTFGDTVEVLIDSDFMDILEKNSEALETKKVQKFNWSI